MKTDFPPAWNPEGLPPPEPGYRYLGYKEPEVKMTDELWLCTKKRWVSFNSLLWKQHHLDRGEHHMCTVRRALCVDDPYAPPPEHWCHPDWMIVTKPQSDVSMQWWDGAKKSWRPCEASNYFNVFYYRRPIGKPPMITSTAPTNDWIPFSVRKPTDAEAGAGIWTVNMKDSVPYADLSKYGRGFFSSNVGPHTHWKPGADAFPPLPKPTLPPAPKLDGVDGKVYEMVYVKGQAIVSFGCAQISLDIIKVAASQCASKVSKTGNRHVRGIMLSSGAEITVDAAIQILDYVDAVNKS